MNIGEIILNSLKFPFSNIKRFFGLLLLFLGYFLLIPIFFAMGYLLKIVEYTIYGADDLPPFDNWGEMFEDGLKYIGANLAYFIIPIIINLVLLFAFLNPLRLGNFQLELSILSFVIALFLFLPFRLIFIMALGNMAHERRFKAAFQFDKYLN